MSPKIESEFLTHFVVFVVVVVELSCRRVCIVGHPVKILHQFLQTQNLNFAHSAYFSEILKFIVNIHWFLTINCLHISWIWIDIFWFDVYKRMINNIQGKVILLLYIFIAHFQLKTLFWMLCFRFLQIWIFLIICC